MSNDGSGCVWGILLSLLLVVVVGISVSMTGLPTWDGALAWDTAATTEREQTKRHEITEDNQTERERIAANAEISRTWAIALTVMVAAGSAAGAVVAWSRRPHRPVPPPQPVTMLPPPHVVNLLSYYRDSVAEYIDGEWCIVNPDGGGYYTATDARRLLEMRNEF